MIQITDTLRIVKKDDLNLAIEKLETVISRKTKEPTLQWVHKGWYGDLKSALKGIVNKQLFDLADTETTLNNLIFQIDEINNNINKIIKKEM